MLKKILNITENVLINSECWTYYKFAIMQTVPNFYQWLSCHMKIFHDQNGNSDFGENGCIYPLSYFSDILNIHDGNILSISKKRIVSYLIEQIDKGIYIIIDLNYQRIINTNDNTFSLHETLIYGYDSETKEFITPLLSDGVFKESRIGFEKLEDAFEDVVRNYTKDKNKLFNRRQWFYGVTCIKPNINYNNTNANYDLINKLKLEHEGFVYKKYVIIEGRELEKYYTYATGLSCLLYLSKFIKKIIIEDNCTRSDIKKCIKCCTKIYENQNMIKSTLEWFVGNEEISRTNLNSLLYKYKKCCETLLINVMRLYKYKQNQNKLLLEKDINDLNDLYFKEKLLLKEIIKELELICRNKL